MRYKWVNGHQIPVLDHEVQDVINPLSCFAEGDADDSGGGDAGDKTKKEDPPDLAAQFTSFQSEIGNALKLLTTEVVNIKKTGGGAADLAELKADLAAIKERFQEKKEDPPANNDTKDEKKVDDQTSQQIKELEKLVKKLTTDLEGEKIRSKEETEKRNAAEVKQRNADRDRLIISAFHNAGGRDDVSDRDILRQFRDDFEFNDDEAWTASDGKDIAAHIKSTLPNFLKKPKTSSGGAGGNSPNQGEKPTIAQLKQQAIELGAKARKEGITSRVYRQFEQAKRELNEAGGDVGEVIAAVTAMS